MSVAELQQALAQIPGVHSARVVGDPEPKEIHLVTTKERAPKQLVRDVQSLASASFGLTIDHRIVSVVQLDTPPSAESRLRPVINHVVVASSGTGGRVDVELRWPDGKTTSGGAASGGSREERVRAAADAVVQALRPSLAEAHVDLSLAGVSAQETGPGAVVVVRLTWSEKRQQIPLVGAALIGDDLVVGTTRAVLDAVNRKLSNALGPSMDEAR